MNCSAIVARVPLQPQVFDLLVFLIGQRDRVVTKDDMIAAVWGGRDRVGVDDDDADQRRTKRDRRFR